MDRLVAERRVHSICVWALLIVFQTTSAWAQPEQWISYQGGEGPGSGKKIVLVSGDEEYRSEEALPMLAKILSTHHGFDCTVLFPIDRESGIVNPYESGNIPGLEQLDSADLMVIFTRFRNLADDQMAAIDRYLKSGKPVVGLRTSTHAFMIPGNSPWAHYGNGYKGPKTEWADGFGRLVLGEKWLSHHGQHKTESTLGRFADGAHDHPITRGIGDGDIWTSTDVYTVRLPLPGDSVPLILGETRMRSGEMKRDDLFFGMREDDPVTTNTKKNHPMMPVAWTKSYQTPGGEKGRAFNTTMGASSGLLSAPLRRLVVNGIYWAVGLEGEIPVDGTEVELVGEYNPTQYGFNGKEFWDKRGLTLDDLR
jgi:hypothetical protein